MRELFQRLYQHGTSGVSAAQRARIQIGNVMAMMGFAVTVTFAFAHLGLGSPEAFALNLLAGVSYLTYFPLQARGLRELGCRLIGAIFLVHLTALTLLFGIRSEFHLYLILGGPIALVLFSGSQMVSRVVMVAASMLIYLALEVIDPAALVQASTGWGQRLMALSSAPTIVFVLIVIHGVYLAEIHKREASLEHAAQTDALTGLPNRRHGFEHALAAFGRARRHGETMAVLMIDLDHFKQVNDRHGHAAGDALLGGVARALEQRLRREDMLARWGGEEFIVIASMTASGDAQELAQALLEHVAALGFRHEGVALPCTASVGVAALSPQDGSLEALLARADRALYEAKARGRSRVVVDATAVAVQLVAAPAAAPAQRRVAQTA